MQRTILSSFLRIASEQHEHFCPMSRLLQVSEVALVLQKSGANGAGAAAGAVALALSAGVVMSALAIDLTDAAVASAILAAGAQVAHYC